MKTDPRIDDYIEKAGSFAQPILRHLRMLWQQALPEGEEGVKWGMPHVMMGGRNVAGMAAFKAHCAMIIHPESSTAEGMGQLGKIRALEDLPADRELVVRLQQAAGAVKAGRKPAAKPKPAIPMPDDFATALDRAERARQAWDGFTDAQRRDYLAWIIGAKREATRAKRIATACEWIGEGKKRNWKYENC
ncbi:YdeI/OmpD-associated family protein [Blastomonas marina]|uniref:YdeI/OmpD-associated family protein n=1 Tax=Blastomonas marina TaxID=1867408 RepID=UPI002AC8E7A0|nr:YdeI/OmpD-associated family protein [Blastomonas marina]WPZ04838.1 YdeI/OmpD-associated family protein [Blastomonas marina]